MFTDTFLDSAWDDRNARYWSTLVSFAVQVLAVGTLLVLPLIYTSNLSFLPFLGRVVIAAPTDAPPGGGHARVRSAASNRPQSGHGIVAPPAIPDHIAAGDQNPIQAAPRFDEVGPPGRNSGGGGNWVDHGTGTDLVAVVAPPPPPVAPRPRVSRMMEGNLIYRVQPEYPALARMAHVQGTVRLHAVISRAGTIENLQAVSGPPLLIKAALDAVKLWRYRPYLLNGEPLEVETQITVDFVLSRE